MLDRNSPLRPIAIVAALLVALPLLLPSLTLSSEVVVFAVGALSVSVLLQRVGLLSFGQGLFFGIGAYASGMLLAAAEISNAVASIGAVLVAVAISVGIGALIARRGGVYFVMLTFAFAQMGFFLMVAMAGITGGENGFADVPVAPLVAGGSATPGTFATYVYLAVLCLLAFAATCVMAASPFGSVQTAIRSNIHRAQALGYNIANFKAATFVFAAAVAALAGAMHTTLLGFVPPSVIEPETSQRLLIMAIIGGAGSPLGAFLGAAFYVVLSDALADVWPRWMMLIAGILIAVVLLAPGGLFGLLSNAFGRVRARG